MSGRRRCASVLMAAATAVSLAACGGGGGAAGGGSAAGAITFISPIPPSVFMFPGFVAEELGYFDEEGIDFTYETIGESVPMTTLLVNGSADVVNAGATEVFQGLAAGQEFDVVFDQTKRAAEGIVVLEDSPVTSVADLRGGTVGLAADEVRSLFTVALDTQGIPADAVEVAVIGTSSATIANSFESGTIDAFVGSVLDFAGLEAAGFRLRQITPEELAGSPAGSFAVTPRTVQERGADLEGFMRAWSKGTHVGLTNPAVVEAVMREVAPEEWEDEATGRATLDLAIELAQQDQDAYGALEFDSWTAAMDQAVVAGDIPQPIALDSFLDERFIEAVNEFDRAELEAAARQWLEQRQG